MLLFGFCFCCWWNFSCAFIFISFELHNTKLLITRREKENEAKEWRINRKSDEKANRTNGTNEWTSNGVDDEDEDADMMITNERVICANRMNEPTALLSAFINTHPIKRAPEKQAKNEHHEWSWLDGQKWGTGKKVRKTSNSYEWVIQSSTVHFVVFFFFAFSLSISLSLVICFFFVFFSFSSGFFSLLYFLVCVPLICLCCWMSQRPLCQHQCMGFVMRLWMSIWQKTTTTTKIIGRKKRVASYGWCDIAAVTSTATKLAGEYPRSLTLWQKFMRTYSIS